MVSYLIGKKQRSFQQKVSTGSEDAHKNRIGSGKRNPSDAP